MAKKQTTPKAPKAVKAPTEAIEPIVEQPATQVLETVENVPNEPVGALEAIPEVVMEMTNKIQSGESFALSDLSQEGDKTEELTLLVEEGDVPADNGVYVLNKLNQPVPAFIEGKTYVYASEVVEDILYAVELGGEIDTNGCRLQGLPYLVTYKIPEDMKEAWETGSKKLTQEECPLAVSFSAPNWFVFIEQLVNAAKLGAVVAPQGVHFKPYIANLKLKKPMESGAYVSVSTEKPKYTFQELDNMNTRQLKIIGKWYGLEKGTKIDLIPAILKLQGEAV